VNDRTMMTNAEYVSKGGMHCPKCNGDLLDALDELVMSYDRAYQEVGCMTCGFQWTDIYGLVGYDPTNTEGGYE